MRATESRIRDEACTAPGHIRTITTLASDWARRPDVRVALVATLGLRLATSAFVALVTYVLGGTYTHVVTEMTFYGKAHGGIATISAPLSGWPRYVTGPWLRWDASIYVTIAAQGYHASGSTAFLPLYPLLIRALGTVLGGHLTLAALLVSTCSAFMMFLLLYRLALRFTGSGAVARTSVLVACLLPISFFFMAPYTESLFLALSLGAIVAALDARWRWAAALGVLASLTRQQGPLLGLLALPALWSAVAFAWKSRAYQRATDSLWHIAGPLAAAVAPGLAYGAWVCYLLFVLRLPAPWQTLTSAHLWNQHFTVPGLAVLADLRAFAAHPGHTLLYNLGLPLDIVATVLAALGLALAVRRLPPGVVLYLVACWAIATCKVMPDATTQSAARYLLALLPLCIVPAAWLARGRPALRLAFVAASLLLAGLCLGEWMLWSWVG